MSTARRRHILGTLAAAALASLATVLALPGGGSAVTQERPGNTAEPRISGTPAVGSTLTASERNVDERADELRVPVGSLPERRGQPRRLELRGDRRCLDHELRGRRRRRRPAPPRARDRGERRRPAHRRLERDRTIRAADTGRPTNVQAPTICGTRRWAIPSRCRRERGTACSRSRSRSSGSAATPWGTTASCRPASRTTRTCSGTGTSARPSAPG